jgi:anti-sigma B factor antagonist
MPEDNGDHFRIEEGRDDGTVVLTLRGELDLASADDVQRRLDALCAAGTPTRLDLDDLAFMDSSGLRFVLQAAELGRDGDWAFTLTPGSEQVRQLFRSAGVAERLPIVPRP